MSWLSSWGSFRDKEASGHFELKQLSQLRKWQHASLIHRAWNTKSFSKWKDAALYVLLQTFYRNGHVMFDCFLSYRFKNSLEKIPQVSYNKFQWIASWTALFFLLLFKLTNISWCVRDPVVPPAALSTDNTYVLTLCQSPHHPTHLSHCHLLLNPH